MTSIELTAEQRRVLQVEQGKPIDVIDTATQQHYVLLAQEQYERVRSLLEKPSPVTHAEPRVPIAPMMLQSQRAFWRDLPELLKSQATERPWVAYHAAERIGFGKTQTEVYQECFRRGLKRGEFYVGKIEEDETPPWGTLEVDWSPHECTDGENEVVPPGAI